MSNEKKPYFYRILFVVTVVLVFLAGLFVSSILQRKAEKAAKFQIVRDIKELEPNSALWGENFPKEYDSWLETADTLFKSKHGGSAKIDYLEEYPELVILWAGYAFSKDYNQGRGHNYTITDINQTLRTGGVKESPLPSTCWTCKSSDVPNLMQMSGLQEFYAGKWKDKGHQVVNNIGCADCHDAKTMKLVITRPALSEAFARMGKDMSKFTHQEKRSLACAQCHVEYYFDKEKGNKLNFPWDKGFSADSMEAYYDQIGFYDWKHKLSRTPMLKAQHPDYELFKTGVHASRGVSCADCHMPYKVEGGVKFSDHKIQSPLNNMENACQVCHRESKERLIQDVYERQDRVLEVRRIAEKSLAKAHLEAKVAWDNGATEEQMKPVLQLIRHSQWRWDWVAAANGVGFHSPVEALRVLGTSIEKSERARGLLAVIHTQLGMKLPITLPDYSSKEKAQALIGLKMDSLRMDKQDLLKNVIPQWQKRIKVNF